MSQRLVRAPLPVLINAGGGTAAQRGAGIVDEVAEAVVALAGGAAVIVGGGDGTLNGAAAALIGAGSAATLGILPLGTHNHLARDLGLPIDLAGAAQVIAAGHSARIDVARVNDRIFLNNASIGLYPALVQRREAVRRLRGLGPKWLADVPAAWVVLKRARHHRLRLAIGGEQTDLRTPLLFVGNNRYGTGLTDLGRRASLEDGLLSVYALGRSTRAGLVRTAFRALLGRADRERDLAAVAEVPGFEARLHGDVIEIALDGEVTRLDGPLRFSVSPRALSVFTPLA